MTAKIGDHVAYVRELRAAAPAYGVAWPALCRRAVHLRRNGGWRLRESLGAGLLDPACGWMDASVSHLESCDVQGMLDASGVGLVSDKIVLATLGPALGIPMPRTYAVLARGGGGWSWHAGEAVTQEGWASAIDRLPDEVVVKPAEGYSGRSVRVLTRRPDGRWDQLGGEPVSTPDLVAELRSDPEFGVWLCDERVANHPDLAQLGAPGVLKTFRVATLVHADGRPEVLWTVFRLPRDGAVDNVRGGARGTMVWVDVANGTFVRGLTARADAPGLVEVHEDPVSGTALPGLEIPLWRETVALAERVALAMIPLRTLGHDIAVTADGPVLIETNAFYDPMPGFPMRPAIERIRAAAG